MMQQVILKGKKHFEQKYIQSFAFSWFNNLKQITLYP